MNKSDWKSIIDTALIDVERYLKDANIRIQPDVVPRRKKEDKICRIIRKLFTLIKIKKHEVESTLKINPALINAPAFGPSFENPKQILWRYQMFRETLLGVDNYAFVGSNLKDETSIKTLVWIMKFRLVFPFLGRDVHFLYPGPVTPEEYASYYDSAKKIADKQNLPNPVPERFYICTWVLEHYRLKSICEVEDGDVVLDIGAYLGDTAIYFSEKCGGDGFVYAFEPLKSNAYKCKENVSEIKNIEVVEKAVSIKAGVSMFLDSGAGSRIVNSDFESDDHKLSVAVTSVDEFVTERGLRNVDFIKMDIEGGERSAINGAAKTIKDLKPKMAISVYHLEDDLWVILEMIKKINSEYEFYLRHYTPWRSETTLFCVPTGHQI